jgi:hypothetical protein
VLSCSALTGALLYTALAQARIDLKHGQRNVWTYRALCAACGGCAGSPTLIALPWPAIKLPVPRNDAYPPAVQTPVCFFTLSRLSRIFSQEVYR